MDVELYVYDLSKGLARQMSLAFLGTQIDAVYHTALVMGDVEYFFGAGVQTCYPGTTHHGQPMEKIKLGRTEVPMELILEYLDSLRLIYTAESYDLFMHNCNNFSNDFSMFLVGKGIPDHITSLPQTVLNTPFGQMLKPQLDQAMRGITQAPVAPTNIPSHTSKRAGDGIKHGINAGVVHNVDTSKNLQELLSSAKESCAVVFFTSSTCPPCRICYEPYERLAEEFADQAVLIKVDVGMSTDIGSQYRVRATPTFMTFLKGDKLEEWSGADPVKLSANVKLLVQMAHPPHPHLLIQLPTLQRSYRPDLYTAVPPLEKLLSKLGTLGQSSEVKDLRTFVQTRYKDGAADATLPDLSSLSKSLRRTVEGGQTDSTFALIDLVRVALVDSRVSGYFIKDKSSPLLYTIDEVCDWDSKALPSTKLVTVQMACNMFSSPILTHHLENGAATLIRLATWLLLDPNSSAKIHECSASLLLNLAKTVHSHRVERREVSLSENLQVEIAVCLLESVQRSEEEEVMKRSALALGLLAFMRMQGGELDELLKGMEASEILQNTSRVKGSVDKALFEELVKVVQ